MRVVGYVRVSRVRQREGARFQSTVQQREAIHSAGHEVVEVFEDLDQPGSKADRPGLEAAMGAVEDGRAAGIVVAKLDRFGRSVVHQGALIERLRDAGGTLFSVAEGVDTSTRTGKLIADILGSIAEWELERIRENWAAAREGARSRGAYLAEAPVGFVKTEEGMLEPDPQAIEVIREAFARRGRGESWAALGRWLDGRLETKRGGAWSVPSVRRLIANPVYRDVVDRAAFEAANAVRGLAPARSGRASGLLSGILRCAGCRYAMKLSQGRSRQGKPFTEYRCKAARGESAGRCQSPASVKATVIEPFVLGAFWAFAGDYRARAVGESDALAEAERALRAAEDELDSALDRRLAEALGEDSDRYIGLIGERQEAVDAARAAVADATRRAQALDVEDVELRKLWPDLSLQEQRRLLASALDCVFIRRTPSGGGAADITGRAHVCVAGEAPALPRRGVRWIPEPFEFPAAAEAVA